MNKQYMAFLGAALLASGCAYEFPDSTPVPYEPTAGGANFNKYVAIGNSITAGYMDGTLYFEGQQSAYPGLLWQSMRAVDPASVNYLFPTVAKETQTGYVATLPGVGPIGRLRFDDPSLSPLYDPATPAPGECAGDAFTPKPMLADVTAAEFFAPTGISPTALGNFGIPGLRLGQFISPGTGTPGNAEFNPYYVRFASAPGSSTPLSDVMKARPTFFTFWLGNNDVLGYAYSGGVAPLTPAEAFMTQYKAIVGALVDSGAKGVVANLPNIMEAPFFQVVTQQIAAVSIPLLAQEAAQLNAAYALQGHPNVAFAEGSANRLLIETHDGQIRQFRPGKDRICLTLALDGQTGLLGTRPIMACGQQVGQGQGMGIANFAQPVDTPFGQVPAAYPIPNRYVLDEDELALAQSALQAYNAAIAGVVAEYEASLGLADMHTAFEVARTKGVLGNGGKVVMTAALTPGGGFSADGIHPNPKGQAWLANVFAQAINARFGSNLQGFDLTQFRGNDFPQ